MLIKRFKKLLETILVAGGLQLPLLIVVKIDISSLLKMVKYICLWKPLL